MSLDTTHSSPLNQKIRIQTDQHEDITSTTGTGGFFTLNDFRYNGPNTDTDSGYNTVLNFGFSFKKNNAALSMSVGGDMSNASSFVRMDYKDFVSDLYQPIIDEAITSPEPAKYPPIKYYPGNRGVAGHENIKGRMETVKDYLSDNKVPTTGSRDFYDWAEEGASQVASAYYGDDGGAPPYDPDNFLHDVATFVSSTIGEKLPEKALKTFINYHDGDDGDPDENFLGQATSDELFQSSFCFPNSSEAKGMLIKQAWHEKCNDQ